jgi:hypothetical protein
MDSGVNMCCSTWINMDTIAEVQVITNSASAAVGHSGGAAVQVVTKGGTKEFHGSGYVFTRNESLNARVWNANSTAANGAIRKSTYRYNTDGFTLGGPVFIPKHWNTAKNKLFFFAAEEHQNTKNGGGNRTLTVPTALERTGDFSQSISNTGAAFTIYDPTAGGQYYGGGPLPGNRLPANLINKDGQKLLSLMPLPNNITSDHTYNYIYPLTPTHKPELLGTYKFDYNINEKWRSFVRYTRDYYTSDNYSGNGSFEFLGTGRGVRKGMGVAYNLATVISPTFTNEFTMGVSQNLIPNLPILNNQYTRSALGLSFNSLFPAGVLADEGPSVSFGGNYISNTPSFGSNFPNFADNTNFNFVDNLAKVFSRHTVTFGFSIERDRKDQSNGNPNGNLNFSTSRIHLGQRAGRQLQHVQPGGPAANRQMPVHQRRVVCGRYLEGHTKTDGGRRYPLLPDAADLRRQGPARPVPAEPVESILGRAAVLPQAQSRERQGRRLGSRHEHLRERGLLRDRSPRLRQPLGWICARGHQRNSARPGERSWRAIRAGDRICLCAEQPDCDPRRRPHRLRPHSRQPVVFQLEYSPNLAHRHSLLRQPADTGQHRRRLFADQSGQ